MRPLADYPILLFLPIVFIALVAASWFGGWLALRSKLPPAEEREDFGVIQAATLTLLGLLIGFTFSMALSRYDQRKNFEEEEANALGTAYLRVELVPGAAPKLKALLREYTQTRVRYYAERDSLDSAELAERTARLQSDLWAAARNEALALPNPNTQLVATSINDVINSQGYAHAATLNRIPRAAWALLAIVALVSNFLVGLGARRPHAELRLLAVFPLVVAVSFVLIADIDAPRGGLIRVAPQNLEATLQSMR